MFVDRIKIQLVAGKGGNGIVAWRREKYIPKGGPFGGNGSPGGSVVFEADPQVFSLDCFRRRAILRAENGGSGGVNQRQGKTGKDLIIKVPCGTLVKDAATGEVLVDLTEPGQRWTACNGGRGGRGNASFSTPTNQAPNYATPGKEGEIRNVELELKLIADVGLVGFPNAGKSTLIEAMAHAKVKIAPYPFTTLTPNLGYVQFEDYTHLLVADIPGIIEGAHQNRGLGMEFLRHIERTRLLLFVLDCSGIDGRTPTNDFQVLLNELREYKEELLQRPCLVVLNKIDTEEAAEHIKEFLKAFPKLDKKGIIRISALSGEGIPQLLAQVHKLTKL